ncbi:MAG: DUF1214 domain-containing protein [Deltaproteobacteria bacterium]
MNGPDPAAKAWRDFCGSLAETGRLIEERSPGSELDRTEGYRYLTRLARMALKFTVEYADPSAPELIRYMDATQKFGVDNPDQLYQWARISGRHAYRLRGRRGTVGYVGIGVYAGSAARGGRRTIAHLRADQLETGEDGQLELFLGGAPRDNNWVELPADTSTLLVRQTMNDRDIERPAELRIECLDRKGPPEPLSPGRLVKGLARAAMQVRGSVEMFADLADRWRETPNRLHPSDTRMAEQSFGDPDLYYMGGYWKVATDEALVIEFRPPQCQYWSFLLCNYWTESLEYRYRPVWTNKARARYRADGSVRIVVAHRDPGLDDTTWVDTEGHREGTMTMRWLLARTTPLPEPCLVRFSEL